MKAHSRRQHPRPSPSAPQGKLALADVIKWRIKYKDSKLPSTIHGYLLRSYPDDEVKWAADEKIEWSQEPHVKLDDINWKRRPGGRDPEKEQSIAESLSRGATMDPIVLCEFESKGVYNRAGLTVADGYHRTGGADKAGWKDVPAFVGRKVPDEYRNRIRGVHARRVGVSRRSEEGGARRAVRVATVPEGRAQP